MLKTAFLLFRILFVVFFIYSCGGGGTGSKSQLSDTTGAAGSLILDDTGLINKTWLQGYIEKMKFALKQTIPVLYLESTNEDVKISQDIALKDARVSKYYFNENKVPMRNEVFNVYEARPTDIEKISKLPGDKFYRVELYNYALDLTTISIVNITQKTVVDVNTFPSTQPEIPVHLKDIAIKLAAKNSDVAKALGYKPGEADALMSNTKTALNNTKCERSLHLCVAPTFVKGEKALWTIVDLTDLKVVGIRWTQVNTTGPGQRISERKLKFEKIMECFCKKESAVKKFGWDLKYIITNSDGLKVYDVQYKQKSILHSAKLVDWHVSYSGTDGFGYSDAVGCPEFSQAAVVAVSEPKISEIVENGKTQGFALEQSFQSEQWPRPCNYNYLQRYEFYSDGRFRVAVGSLGRGCGNDGTYRPVIRIFFSGDNNLFTEWNGESWKPWDKEGWQLQTDKTNYSSNGFQYTVKNTSFQFGLEPSKGQFSDKGRGDNAWLYITKYHADKDEGEKDLVTIGPCCNTDYRQGPEKFIEPKAEALGNGKFVLWYVPQIKNDNTPGNEYCWADSYLENGVFKTKIYPCMSGPMFVPIQ